MLWVKVFHIIFVISWFAGLFYLPRIFVNLSLVSSEKKLKLNLVDNAEYLRLILMAKKLFRFMGPLMILSIFFGMWLWIGYGVGFGTENTWMHIKLVCVIFLIIYHFYCGLILRKFILMECKKSHIWFRWFNEIPVLLLLVTTILVVIKPF